MKKQNGFIFMETIVVVSVLSITLLLLFTSYSYILRKARERNVFDTSDTIYKTFYIERLLVNNASDSRITNMAEFIRYSTLCGGASSTRRTCDFTGNTSYASVLSLKNSYGLQKIYYLRPSELYDNQTELLKYDATTIDYIRKLGNNSNMHRIYKFKKCYDDACTDYEIFHASVEEVPAP